MTGPTPSGLSQDGQPSSEPVERMRRPRNLKPCHEISVGLPRRWVRVLSVEQHPGLPDTLTVYVQDGDATRPWLLHPNQPVRSRLAPSTEEHDDDPS